MRDKMVAELAMLKIYESKSISKEEYKEKKDSNKDDSIVYIESTPKNGVEGVDTLYKEIKTNGKTIEEIQLELAMKQLEYQKTTRNIAIFFLIVWIIQILMSLLGLPSLEQSINL